MDDIKIVIEKRNEDLIASLWKGRKYQRLYYELGKMKFEDQIVLKDAYATGSTRIPNVVSQARKRFKKNLVCRKLNGDFLIFIEKK